MKNIEKEIKDLKKKKTELEKKIGSLKEKHLKIGIPVPEKEGYEI
jgi:predicted  nucleic acid-binding Zn-ribbon protein